MTDLNNPLVRFAFTARTRGVTLGDAWALWTAEHDRASYSEFIRVWNNALLYASVPTR